MNRYKNNDFLLLVLIVTALFIVNLSSFINGHDWGGDFSMYISQAKSIVDGSIGKLLEISKYRYYNSDPVAQAPILYPWGYPLLLSGVYYFFGLSLLPMKIFTNLFFLLSLPIIFVMFKNKIGRLQAFMIIIILGINPQFFKFKDNILSDIPFMFFSLLTVFLIQRFIIEKKLFYNETFSNVIIGLSIFISFAIRSNGIILLPTLFMVQLIENLQAVRSFTIFSWRNTKLLIPYAVFFVLTLILIIILPRDSLGSYYDQLMYVRFSTILSNLGYYAILPADFFSDSINLFFTIIGVILFIISIPFAYFGVVKTFRENYHYIVFSAFLVVIDILLPGIKGLRYIFPILPFYLFFLFEGLNEKNYFIRFSVMKRYVNLNFMIAFGLATIFIFGLTISSRTIHILTHKQEILDGPYSKDSIELFNYISKYTSDQDIIIFYKPRVLTLYTGRKAVVLSSLRGIMASKASYITCKKNDEVDNLLHNSKLAKSKIFENSTFNLYRK